MTPFGLPRHPDLEHPDKADIKRFGLASTDRCARADRGKTSTRRIWKKKARAAQRAQLRQEGA
jgi:hypothetical protein